METIKSYIEKIFKRYGYKTLIAKDEYLILSGLNNNDFWIVTHSFDVNNQDLFFKICEKEIEEKRYEAFEKNVSLLYLNEVDSITTEIRNESVKIENNPFYFKKYVLLYEKSAWDDLATKISDDINTCLLNPLYFDELKTDNCSPFSLLYEIAHKLPFFKIQVESSENIEVEKNFSTSNEQINDTYKWLTSLKNDKDTIEHCIEKELEAISND
ncbi:ABC-three component system middle component 1 [Hallerella succinigenes]|uniref:Uncharacterized protein n=1 Tax=Hallerella succinigenes TaxID=1896222 RepID=A0A2M9A6N5_9BACT|nr:ABC-three component system middle component 1 [Hallerella succinigenes]PJJ41380.1 hypothetical protein BGX16_1344 [Hallerella succinigenes]